MNVSAGTHWDAWRVLSVVELSAGSGDGRSSSPQLVVGWRRDHDDAARFRLAGELDGHSAATVREACDTLLDGFERVRADLDAVSFIDIAGSRFLEECCDRMNRRGGDIRLCNPSRAVRRTFTLLGLEALLTSEPPLRGDNSTMGVA